MACVGGEYGVEAMSRMIIENSNDALHDLFFGDWREEFEHYKNLPETISEYVRPVHEDYHPPTGTVHLPGGKKFR